MDIRNQCSGFLYALSTANAFIKTGQYRRVLVVGSEIHSAGLDMTPRGRDVSVIFGDGAAACVVEPCEEGRGILNAHIYSEGKYFDKLFIPESGCINTPRVTHEMIDKGTIWPKMEGKYVFKHAVTRMPEAIQTALDTCGRKVSDIDLLVCHQANLRINEMVAAGMDIPQEKIFNNIQKYGNTTAATIPLCLTEAREQGRLKDGDFVVLVAFGAGFTWGSAALVW
jgi:3-oxoacyl-[acyl-carrier-protein] synthase-3